MSEQVARLVSVTFAQKVAIPVRESGRMTVAQQFTAGLTSEDIAVRGADD